VSAGPEGGTGEVDGVVGLLEGGGTALAAGAEGAPDDGGDDGAVDGCAVEQAATSRRMAGRSAMAGRMFD
jgi:hypothetical protein